MSNKHFNRLVKMYENAPINKIFNPNIKISLGKSEISILAKSDFFILQIVCMVQFFLKC